MATGMADVRQGIVFCIEIDQSPTRATQRLKCRLEAISVARNYKPLPFQKVADCIVSTVLLVGKFGVRPDLAITNI